MRILLTRPINDSHRIERQLGQSKIIVYVEPLMHIESLNVLKINALNYQALVFTSANGVMVYCKEIQKCALPVYVVGESTRQAALEAGLNPVISAGADVKKLSATIISKLSPSNGPLLYLTGKHVAGNLAKDLEDADFQVDHQKIYTAVAAQQFSNNTKSLLKQKLIDYIHIIQSSLKLPVFAYELHSFYLNLNPSSRLLPYHNLYFVMQQSFS